MEMEHAKHISSAHCRVGCVNVSRQMPLDAVTDVRCAANTMEEMDDERRLK